MVCGSHSEEMNTYFIPTDGEFVEEVARAIARGRMQKDASEAVKSLIGRDMRINGTSFEKTLDSIFEKLWAGDSDVDKHQRECYMNDALAAISIINLKLITST
jgi:hypothetical protein